MNIKGIAKTIWAFTKKNSPFILSGAGAVSIGIGTVKIVKKAKKQEEVLDKPIAKNIEDRKNRLLELKFNGDIDEKFERKAITKLYLKKAYEYTKYYFVPSTLILGGASCMFASTLIQTKRLKYLSASYTALATAFSSYRERVKEAVGEEKENDIFFDVKRDKEGNIIETGKKNLPTKQEVHQQYHFSRLYGDGYTPYWSKDTRLCLTHIRGAEGNLNENLRTNGFVTLNDVYKELGFRPSEEGMYIGWKYVPNDPVYGDTHIDLGFCGQKNEEKYQNLSHSWNTEIWMEFDPPHVLFGCVPKEKRYTDNQKFEISKRRKQIHEPFYD